MTFGIVAEISLGAFGEHDDDHRRKRIDIYFIDRESRCVVAVELKCSSDLPRVIAAANAKYGPFLARGPRSTRSNPPAASRCRSSKVTPGSATCTSSHSAPGSR